ncbi:hypothetical protein E1293_04630 [Actinomadura darangshiensis]|uniref:Uncharacterized protein n=1 Tax=Actinomadura darangshiensis TaxID=705336 RepID=A0A4R5BTX0_9ACTN|nr:hypothetical protein [Actinomadura darangshiensis]TDD89499.1 hypothetical protein E1293_04630 [Actinomadura darangshiensis]
MALTLGAVDALSVPAVAALPSWITSSDQLARPPACTLSMRLSQIAGPPRGGPAMGFTAAAATLTISGLLFAFPAAPADDADAVLEEQSIRGTAHNDLLDGRRYNRRHRLISPLAVAGAVSGFGVTGTPIVEPGAPLQRSSAAVHSPVLARPSPWHPAQYGRPNCPSAIRNDDPNVRHKNLKAGLL